MMCSARCVCGVRANTYRRTDGRLVGCFPSIAHTNTLRSFRSHTQSRIIAVHRCLPQFTVNVQIESFSLSAVCRRTRNTYPCLLFRFWIILNINWKIKRRESVRLFSYNFVFFFCSEFICLHFVVVQRIARPHNGSIRVIFRVQKFPNFARIESVR